MIGEFSSFAQMLSELPNDKACREYLELKRWNGTPVCPHCGILDEKHYRLKVKGEFKGMYKCRSCRERFTVTMGTVFEGSPIPLRKWFIAIYLFASHKKGISSHQLARDLGVTQKTGWFMLHRLRMTFNNDENEPLDGMVEADETYIGGKNWNRHEHKKIKQADGAGKTPVVGLVERNGKIKTFVVTDTTGPTLHAIVIDNVGKEATLITDSYNSYTGLDKSLNHIKVKPDRKTFKTDKHLHTNTIEGFWSIFKRGLYGIYHQVSPKHLQAYSNEFGFRYNTRQSSDKERFDIALVRTGGVKLGYSVLIGKASS